MHINRKTYEVFIDVTKYNLQYYTRQFFCLLFTDPDLKRVFQDGNTFYEFQRLYRNEKQSFKVKRKFFRFGFMNC